MPPLTGHTTGPIPLPPPPPAPPAPPRLGWGAVVAWSAVALMIRFVPVLPVFFPNGFPASAAALAEPAYSGAAAMPAGSDALYHLRRIVEVTRRFPEVPTWDGYLDYPDGAVIPYEPGFDLMLAWICRILRGDDPSEAAIARICCAVIPLLGMLLVPLYGNLTRQLFGGGAARLALPLLAILPGCAWLAGVGQVDHHVLEPLLFGLPFVPLLSALHRAEQDPQHPDLANLATITGLCLGAGFFFWRATVLPAALIAGYLGLRTLARVGRARLDGFGIWGGALTLGVAFAVATPLCVAHPLGLAGILSYFTLSWFQPLYLLALSLGLGLMGLVASTLERWPSRGFGSGGLRFGPGPVGVAALAGILPMGVLCWMSPAFTQALLGGLGFLGRQDLFVKAVVEQLPLFVDFDGELELLTALSMLGLPLLLLPVWLGILVRYTRPRGGDLFGWWFAAVGVMALMQQRYVVLFAPVYAMAVAAAVEALRARWADPRRGAPEVGARRGHLLMAVFSASLLPTLGVVGLGATAEPQSKEIVDVCRWLRNHTPRTGGYHLDGSGARPEYAVVAPWTMGHHLIYLAQRPAVATPFGIEWFRRGVARSARFLLSEAPAEVMAELGARYALVGFQLVNLRRQAPLADRVPDDYAVRTDAGWRPGPHFARSAAARLYLWDGLEGQPSGGEEAPSAGGSGLPNLRLLYETPVMEVEPSAAALAGGPIAAFKIFERVASARLVGQAPPGATVTAEVTVRTNLDRAIPWRTEAVVGPTGLFSVEMPYGTRGAPPDWAWGEDPARVEVWVGGRRTRIGLVSVRDQDVLEGLRVPVRWQEAVLGSGPRRASTAETSADAPADATPDTAAPAPVSLPVEASPAPPAPAESFLDSLPPASLPEAPAAPSPAPPSPAPAASPSPPDRTTDP